MRGIVGMLLVAFGWPLWASPLNSLTLTNGVPMHGWLAFTGCLTAGLTAMLVGTFLIYAQVRSEK